ncbi:MAG: hypothetical protein JNJ70_10220 [Verrucomicrobiales bacterium]|nr:hypothetical protein [Verrucomicrobiales bacterium]
MTVHVVVPTFRESGLVGPFLESWDGVRSVDLALHVVNGNPDDETSTLLSEWQGRHSVTEHRGHPGLFWTGLVALGLREVARVAGEGDFFLITNIDVRPAGDPLSAILAQVPSPEGHQVAIPVTGSGGKVSSSAVVVRSWALSLNRHLGEGQTLDEMPRDACLAATYLPTRFLLVPAKALSEGLFPDEVNLPHYCADYEYTNRLRLAGYAPLLFTGAHATLVEENTGFDTFLAKTSLWSRIRKAWDIKCPYNLRYRYRFVRLVYPRAAFLPGLCSHFAKIFLEIALGGHQLRRLRKN